MEKKMFKKAMALLMAGCMIFSMAACGGKDTKEVNSSGDRWAKPAKNPLFTLPYSLFT